jgi:hypothetical protein
MIAVIGAGSVSLDEVVVRKLGWSRGTELQG